MKYKNKGREKKEGTYERGKEERIVAGGKWK